MNKNEREELEYKSLYSDERYAKRAFRQLIGKALESDAVTLPIFTDSQGNITPQSEIYKQAYTSVEDRLKKAGLSRKPMKAELMIEASVIRAAFDTNVLNVILDRTAGKVKEEISIGMGAYEELTDEQLEVLAQHEANKIAMRKDEDKDA